MKVQFVDSLFASLATIGIALVFKTVYAMPMGWLAGASLRMVLSHKALTGIPNKWCLDQESRSEIHGFGKWIFLSTAMTFVISGGDRMLLGYYINSQQMGLYAIAFLLASTAQTLLHKFNSVGLPLFSEVARERPSELPSLFYRLRLPVDVASLFIAGGLVGGSQFIIDLFYDPRYAGSAPMLAVLSLLVVASRYDLVSASWMALGHTKWLTVLSFFKMVTLLVALPLGFHLYGTLGAVWGIVAASMINHPLGWWFMRKTGLLNWRKELLPLPAALLGYGCGLAAQAAYAYLKTHH
jgi:O-antigen/teichoic acid export membrane protein